MANIDYPEPVKLPSPDELMAIKNTHIASAKVKLLNLGLTEEETRVILGTYSLFD
jgi:hypothetical protein